MQAIPDTFHPMSQTRDPRFSWASSPEDVFIARMARERKRRGWTMETLAEQVEAASGGAVRMHQSAFTKLEREHDRRNLRLDEAFYISEALGLTLSRMLSDEDLEGVPARIRDLELRHRELIEELQRTDARHNSIVSLLNEIGAEVAALRGREEVAPPTRNAVDPAIMETAPSKRPPPRFELYQDKAGKYRFRLKAGNGEVIFVGEPYESKAAAQEVLPLIAELSLADFAGTVHDATSQAVDRG